MWYTRLINCFVYLISCVVSSKIARTNLIQRNGGCRKNCWNAWIVHTCILPRVPIQAAENPPSKGRSIHRIYEGARLCGWLLLGYSQAALSFYSKRRSRPRICVNDFRRPPTTGTSATRLCAPCTKHYEADAQALCAKLYGKKAGAAERDRWIALRGTSLGTCEKAGAIKRTDVITLLHGSPAKIFLCLIAPFQNEKLVLHGRRTGHAARSRKNPLIQHWKYCEGGIRSNCFYIWVLPKN